MNNKRKQLIVKIVAHLVLLLGAITMLVPFIWMLSSSVKSLGEVKYLYSRRPCLEKRLYGRTIRRFPAVLITWLTS